MLEHCNALAFHYFWEIFVAFLVQRQSQPTLQPKSCYTSQMKRTESIFSTQQNFLYSHRLDPSFGSVQKPVILALVSSSFMIFNKCNSNPILFLIITQFCSQFSFYASFFSKYKKFTASYFKLLTTTLLNWKLQ